MNYVTRINCSQCKGLKVTVIWQFYHGLYNHLHIFTHYVGFTCCNQMKPGLLVKGWWIHNYVSQLTNNLQGITVVLTLSRERYWYSSSGIMLRDHVQSSMSKKKGNCWPFFTDPPLPPKRKLEKHWEFFRYIVDTVRAKFNEFRWS